MSSITSEEAKEATVPLKKPDHLPAVPDHRVNYKRRAAPPTPRRKNDCCKRFLVFLSTVFCLSTLALVGILLWREFSHLECDRNPGPVHEKFLGYFRTLEEQKSYEEAVNRAPKFHNIITGPPYVSVNESNTDILLGNDDSVCCPSDVTYVALRNLSNIYGTEMKIAQFQDRFQFFRVEACKQQAGCASCQCVQTYITVTAVFEKESSQETEYGLNWFPIPTNCRCKLGS